MSEPKTPEEWLLYAIFGEPPCEVCGNFLECTCGVVACTDNQPQEGR